MISRNSARRYAGTDKTVQQIGEELGATHILEGRIRWAKGADGASRIRITPELILVADDTQIWSATLDREIEDIFALQGEIAELVAKGLGVELGDSELAELSSRPTESAEAYQAYLRGLEIIRSGYDAQAINRSAEMFQLAVDLDPDFAHAWAHLSRRIGESHYNGFYPLDASRDPVERLKEAVDRGLEIAPDDPLTRLALGYYYYYGLGDFAAALEVFDEVARGRPNDTDAIEAGGWVKRRLGRWDDFFAAVEQLLILDPGATALMSEVADTHMALRQFDQAEILYEGAIGLSPNVRYHWEARVGLELYGRGSISGAREILDRWPGADLGRYVDVLRFERDWPGYLAAAEALEPDGFNERVVRYLHIGNAHARLGNEAAAGQAFEKAHELLPDDLGASPNQLFSFVVGYVAAALGRSDEAVRIADALRPINPNDRYGSPGTAHRQALLYAHAGKPDRAIELLEGLLETPYSSGVFKGFSVTRASLRLDPLWDPLRGIPEFEGLIAD